MSFSRYCLIFFSITACFGALEPMAFWKQPRYLHKVWDKVRIYSIVPDPTCGITLGMEVPSNVESISVISATEYWGIFLLRYCKFFPAIKVHSFPLSSLSIFSVYYILILVLDFSFFLKKLL